MSFTKKNDPRQRSSAIRATTRHPHSSAAPAKGTGFSKIGSGARPGLTKVNVGTFAEDFKLEHSLSNVSITLISISANADLVENATPRDLSAYDLKSPSCAYIG